MKDYLTIAEKIEDLSLKTSDKIIGMPLDNWRNSFDCFCLFWSFSHK